MGTSYNSKKIIIEGLKEKDLDYLSIIKKMIADFKEQQQEKLSWMNAMHFYIEDDSDFGISIYQSKTKIFVQFRNKQLNSD